MKPASAALVLLALAAAAPASAQTPDAPIVFERDADHCYRIPSLAFADGKFAAVVQSRSGFDGRRPCSDDGDIDLVAKTSDDGRKWSGTKTVLDNDALSDAMSDPKSELYDRDYAKVGRGDRFMRLGAQALGAVDKRLVVTFAARFNLRDDCGDRFGCENSPENLESGVARERFFEISSDDFGRSWSKPKRIHSQIYQSCIANFFKEDGDLQKALTPLFADDATISDSAAAVRDDLVKMLGGGRNRRRADPAAGSLQDAADRLGVDEAVVRKNADKLRMLFNPKLRVGPGNMTVFPYRGGTRIFAPGGPLAFYSDDLGKTWTCSNTFAVTRGSERQAAWLGEGRMVMTLRQIGGRLASQQYRLFATSTDGGASWSSDDNISANGRTLLPDPVSQGSIVGIEGTTPPSAVVSNIANQRANAVRNDDDDEAGEGRTRREERAGRRGDRRMERRRRPDPRINLALTRVFFDGAKLSAGFRAQCDAKGATTETLTIWPGSASYSAIVSIPERKSVGVLFEGSDDDGPMVGRLAWAEAIRFKEVPLETLGGAPEAPVCR